MAMKSSGSMPGKKGAIFMTTFIPQSRCDDLRVDDASVLELYGLIADSVRGASPSIARLHPLHHLAMSVFALRGCWHVWNSHLHKKQYRWNGKAGEGQMVLLLPTPASQWNLNVASTCRFSIRTCRSTGTAALLVHRQSGML